MTVAMLQSAEVWSRRRSKLHGVWVAVKELKLSYYNGYIGFRDLGFRV